MSTALIKTIGAITAGAAALASGAATQAPAAPEFSQEQREVATADGALAQSGIAVSTRAQESFDKIANVKGEFEFNQKVITPSDEVFNLFGTVTTAMCAKPNYAFGEIDIENYYINFSGAIKKTETVNLNEVKTHAKDQRTLKCSCATGAAVANAQVVGIPLANIVEMAQVDETANTVTFKSADGYGIPMPLSYALEQDAILVYQIGDKPVPSGTQVWVPKSVARYFTRNVAEIEFTAQEQVPEVLTGADEHRAKISVVNRFENETFAVGDQIVFEGYADDFGEPITAVEFSLDGGATWTECAVKDATAEKWVYWYFGYVTEKAGTFKLDVRARAADGTVSPMASSVIFTVK